jgi:hypothetical protein
LFDTKPQRVSQWIDLCVFCVCIHKVEGLPMAKDKKEKKDKDKDKEEKQIIKKKKKGPPRLPPEFALGARIEIIRHDLESMVAKRGISLGEFKVTDTPRKRVTIAMKLEAPLKKGSTVDTSKIEGASSVARQRIFAGSIDARDENPIAHIPADDLKALSPPGRADDDGENALMSTTPTWSMLNISIASFLLICSF